MNEHQYTDEYFSRYRTIGRFVKRERGERLPQFNYWRRYISKHSPIGSRILEVGCGLGYFSKVASRAFEYVGTDIAFSPLREARKKNISSTFIQSSAGALGFRSGSFDVVVAFDILEHISTPESAIAEIYRVLRDKGKLIVTVPNVRSLGNRVKSISKGLVPSMYTDETHVSLLSAEEWEDLFTKYGFDIIRIASDTLWDIPYTRKVPQTIQKLFLIPFNLFITACFGGLPWKMGENLIIVCEK